MISYSLIVLTGLASLCSLISAYGTIKNQRLFFFRGLFLYSLLVVPNELIFFFDTGKLSHLLISGLWSIQFVLAFPTKIKFDATNTAMVIFIKKILLSFIIINICGICIALYVASLPDFFALFHGIFCVLSAVFLIKFHSREMKAQ